MCGLVPQWEAKKEMAKLVVIDGLDGSGKATQVERIMQLLVRGGETARQISFPDYVENSSALVKMYLNGDFGEDASQVNPYAISTFYAVDRFSSYKLKWEKAYQEPGYIIADRYVTSNMIHQMGKLDAAEWSGFCEWLMDLEYTKFCLPQPEIVVYLDLMPMICMELLNKRCCERGVNDLHERDGQYLARCRQAAMFAANRFGWRIINCSDENGVLPQEAITEKIFSVLAAAGVFPDSCVADHTG
ncbi:MAG: deoxynucleoside kinase [Oscillospiraceae bacterium]|jgi:dTMP kinase|nr:deoxynucleoside kinase [Oscillospiraceae bacterium]